MRLQQPLALHMTAKGEQRGLGAGAHHEVQGGDQQVLALRQLLVQPVPDAVVHGRGVVLVEERDAAAAAAAGAVVLERRVDVLLAAAIVRPRDELVHDHAVRQLHGQPAAVDGHLAHEVAALDAHLLLRGEVLCVCANK